MKRLASSFKYAVNGIFSVIKTEKNMQIHLSITALVILLGLLLHISSSEWLVVIICIGLVLSMETVNTALEELVNLISPEKNFKAGLIKDMAAGAVLISAIISVVIGIIIFLPKILNLFFN